MILLARARLAKDADGKASAIVRRTSVNDSDIYNEKRFLGAAHRWQRWFAGSASKERKIWPVRMML
jgi:hypothetical protein